MRTLYPRVASSPVRPSLLLAAFAPLLGACGTAVVRFDEAAIDDTNATGFGALQLSAASLDLGYGAIDEVLAATIIAENVGTAPLDLSGSIVEGATHFSLDFTDASLLPNDALVLTVQFSADTLGTYGGSLDFISDDPDRSTVSVPLTAVVAQDEDNDGYVVGDDVGSDCDDADADVHPGATDTAYDGVDTDCSGTSDYDADGDGYDSAAESPEGAEGADCDDTRADVSPEATEVWYDGVDQDCNNRSDYDADGDGHDSAEDSPDGTEGDDCDDTNADVYTGNLEDPANGVDDDCDGLIDETPGTTDDDGDGYSEAAGDCDDTNADISPAAAEVWYDGLDSDCAGDNDYDQDADGFDASDGYSEAEGDCDDTNAEYNPDAVDVIYDGIDADCSGGSDYDADSDGYDAALYGGDDCDDGNPNANPGASEVWYDSVDADCSGGSDYDYDGDGQDSSAYTGADCNDADPTVYSGAPETWYDGVDADCSGGSDYDQDGDGYDAAATGGTDCDDTQNTTNPGATETWYDGLDADCSGGSDYDQDGDGYTSIASGGTDCDDTQSTTNPGATETWYDGVDADCSGGSDYDQDGDGTASTASGGTDCDDEDAAIYAAATEICDSKDNDCDGTADDGIGSTWYRDADADTYGNPAISTLGCSAPAGYVADYTDCDDDHASANPGAAEVAYDTLDNDCDGLNDEMTALAESDWTVIGTSASHAIGATVGAVIDDEDGDGYAELVLASTTDDIGGTNAGALAWHDYGLRGTGVLFTSGYLQIYGESGDDAFGTGFASVGDIDGWDYGESEFIAGAANDDDEESNGGAVYIFDTYGSSFYTGNKKISDLWQVKLHGSSANEYFGADIATADIDGDSGADIVVGAWGKSSSRGNVYVYTYAGSYWYGIGAAYQYLYDDDDADRSVRGTAGGDKFGMATAAGDVDGDGHDDIATCAPEFDASSATTSAGGCWVIDPDALTSSSVYTVTSVDSVQISGAASSDGVGSTAQSIAMGDIDGDGLADLVIGAPGYDGTETNGGAVAVFFASSLTGTQTIAAADTLLMGDGAFGTSTQVGDFGGGSVGLLAGAPTGGSGNQGIVYAASSKLLQDGGTVDISTEAYGSWLGESASDSFGATLSNLYDVDNDGTDDIVAGASGWDNGATSAAGKAYVLPLW